MAGITLEPNVKPASPTRNITHEDFVDQLDRIEPANTPLTTFCRNAVELQSTDRKWTVDSFPNPKGATGRADGQSVTTATSTDWTANMRPIGNIGQGFDEQFGVGWIAQRVPKIAGVPDPLSYAKTSAYLMLKQHMEVAFSSLDQTAVVDAGSGLGSTTAGYRKLVDAANKYATASAFALGKPSDLHFSPVSACVTGGATSATFSRSFLKTVAYQLRIAAKRKVNWTLIAGLSLRQQVTNLTNPSQATVTATTTASVTGFGLASAPSQATVYTRAEQDNELGQTVDVIVTDFGRIMVVETDYIGTTTTGATGGALTGGDAEATARAARTFLGVPYAGLIVEKGNLFKVWGITPYTVQLGQDGSGDVFDAKCFAMLGVNNPIRAAFWNFTS